MEVTSTAIVQSAPTASVPSVKVTVLLPAGAVSVPPQVGVVVALGGSATTTSAGSGSDSDTSDAPTMAVLRRV